MRESGWGRANTARWSRLGHAGSVEGLRPSIALGAQRPTTDRPARWRAAVGVGVAVAVVVLLVPGPLGGGTRVAEGHAAPGWSAHPAPPAVNRTFKNCSLPSPGPSSLTYDAADHAVYTSDGNAVEVVQGVCTWVRSVALLNNSTAGGIAFDPLDRSVYVSDGTNGCVFVLKGLHIVHTVKRVPGAASMVYDPPAGGVAVVHGSDVSLIVGARITATVVLTFNPWTITYSPNGSVLGAAGTHYVGVVQTLNGSTLAKLHYFGIGGSPSLGVTCDPANHLTCFGQFAGVTVVNLAAGTTVKTLTFSYKLGYANAIWCPQHHDVEVVFWWVPDVYAIHGTSIGRSYQVTGAQGLFVAIYDPLLHALAVTTGGWGHLYFAP